jgi:SAM-dependent methyltransferase
MSLQRLSWRDPSGFVVRDGHRILRAVLSDSIPTATRLLEADWLQAHIRAGRIPASRWVDDVVPAASMGDAQLRWIEHERLSFPAYPHEVSALQLFDAAKLTLALAMDALAHDWTLKDAAAWNVLFDHGRPVFCDLMSFEPFAPDANWMAYAQFQRCFTIPLLVHKKAGIAPRIWFLLERDGLSPEAARSLLRKRAAWRQPGLEAVTLPTLLHKRGQQRRAAGATHARAPVAAGRAKHVVRATLRRLARHIDALKPTTRDSQWVEYETSREHYGAEDLRQKSAFVGDALADPAICSVLDLGCNTGEYSVLAANLGKSVVAVDADDASIQRLYERRRAGLLDISPMVLNIARPPPALGWMNSEIPSFLDRATARFDCVMALGLIHHLAVTERVPLELIVQLLQRLTTATLIVEWVEREDPRFQQLAGPNLPLYRSLTRQAFELLLSGPFQLRSSLTLPCRTRTLYCWKLKSSVAR